MSSVILTAYMAVAGYFAWDAFRRGVWQRPAERLFRTRHQVLLTMVALLSGVLWILAVPALLGRGAHTRSAGRRAGGRFRSWAAIRQAHVRS